MFKSIKDMEEQLREPPPKEVRHKKLRGLLIRLIYLLIIAAIVYFLYRVFSHQIVLGINALKSM